MKTVFVMVQQNHALRFRVVFVDGFANGLALRFIRKHLSETFGLHRQIHDREAHNPAGGVSTNSFLAADFGVPLIAKAPRSLIIRMYRK